MKVRKTACDQCLFSKNRIVWAVRKNNILRSCLKEDSYFICHKATIEEQDICCRGYWDRFKDQFNLGRIVQRLGGPEFTYEKGYSEEVASE